jgi:hypothetical protein
LLAIFFSVLEPIAAIAAANPDRFDDAGNDFRLPFAVSFDDLLPAAGELCYR